MTTPAIERLARVIYEAAPEDDGRGKGDVILWEQLPDEFPHAKERAFIQAQAVLDFATQGGTP